MIISQYEIASGVVHRIPADLRNILTADKTTLTIWEDITQLARNEWICWIEDAEKPETRRNRIERVRTAAVQPSGVTAALPAWLLRSFPFRCE